MKKLLLLASLAVVLSLPAWNARAESPEQYQMNLEAHYGQVKGLDAAKLPAEKHLKLWQDFLDRFPHDNPHADVARERIQYWTSQNDGQPPATQPPAPPATQTPPPQATQPPAPPATAAPSPPPAPTQASSPAPPAPDAQPEPPPGSSNPGPGLPGGPSSGLEIGKILCAYEGNVDPRAGAIGTSPADPLALQAVEDIAALVGQPPGFELFAGDVETAVAVLASIDGQVRKAIVYSPEFVASLRGPARGRWLVYGVLAHEMAHHMSRRMSQDGSKPDDELWADDFSGAMLYRLGSSLEQAQEAVQMRRGAKAPGYPSRKARRVAVANGWRAAADRDPDRRRGPRRSKKPGRTGTSLPE